MKRADGKKLVSGVSGGTGVQASVLPEPVTKALSQYPQGNVLAGAVSATAPSLDPI